MTFQHPSIHFRYEIAKDLVYAIRMLGNCRLFLCYSLTEIKFLLFA